MRRKYGFVPAVALLFLLVPLSACASGRGRSTPPAATSLPTTHNAPASALPNDSSSPAGQPGNNGDLAAPFALSGEVTVTFDYKRQTGSASNQFAIWVEDTDGNYINTICATKWTANGGYKSRPDSVALWVEKSGISSLPDYYADAVSGATPRVSGSLSYTWNLKDVNGDTVSPGEYKVFIEGTLRWKNHVIYSGVITIGDAPATILADAEFNYEASAGFAALTSDSPENEMIKEVTVSFAPVAAG
ncbi:MAG: DUF2271 domain-containing protein [Oscillospiraceae bacterium]|nr:DUF2271 domain-containing protein [Oscillospiraceae bacterium]